MRYQDEILHCHKIIFVLFGCSHYLVKDDYDSSSRNGQQEILECSRSFHSNHIDIFQIEKIQKTFNTFWMCCMALISELNVRCCVLGKHSLIRMSAVIVC